MLLLVEREKQQQNQLNWERMMIEEQKTWVGWRLGLEQRNGDDWVFRKGRDEDGHRSVEDGEHNDHSVR